MPGRSSKLQRKSGKVYMMMETVVYSREYLFAKDLYDRGVLGRIQFLRGSHQQDMDGWPDYWPGLPPMWYATHCVSPCLAILCDPAKSNSRSPRASSATAPGRIREELIKKYNSPFAIETATFKIKGSDVVRRSDAQPVRHRPAVPRELRRHRQQRQLRVAAGGGRRAGAAHAGLARSRRSPGA